jgi:vacuolar-type H+-ATPase subunit I/STV1
MKKLLLIAIVSIYSYAQDSKQQKSIDYNTKIDILAKEIYNLKKQSEIDKLKIREFEKILLNNTNTISTHSTILQNKELSKKNTLKRELNTLRDTIVDTQFDTEAVSYDVRKLKESISSLKSQIKELKAQLNKRPRVIIKEVKTKEQKLKDIKLPKMKGGYFILYANREDVSIKSDTNHKSKVIKRIYRDQPIRLSECMANGWCKLYKQDAYVARYLLREKGQ